MAEQGEDFAMPGGNWHLEELFEIMTLNQTHLHSKALWRIYYVNALLRDKS